MVLSCAASLAKDKNTCSREVSDAAYTSTMDGEDMECESEAWVPSGCWPVFSDSITANSVPQVTVSGTRYANIPCDVSFLGELLRTKYLFLFVLKINFRFYKNLMV